MRLNKILSILAVALFLTINTSSFQLNAKDREKEEININFKNLEIEDFIKITTKIIGKNILLTSNIKGKVEFISNKPIYKEDLLSLAVYVLESKGYTIVESDNILRVVKLSDAAKYNVPVYKNSKMMSGFMVTEVFQVEFSNVDYVSSKIRHLISKSAKLVTDKESNSIVITDFPPNIKTVKKVVSYITQDREQKIEIIKLKNIQASGILADLKAVAKSVFNEKVISEKVEVLLNKDTNAIMFVGKEKNVEFLKEYLVNIDKEGSLVEKVVEVIYLKNAESKNIIKILNGIITQKVYKDKTDKPFASTDDESNSIILMGPKEEIQYFTKLIKKLDIERQQVYVKARIIEVSEEKSKDLGIKYGLIAGKSKSNTGLLTMAANMGGDAITINPESMGLTIPSLTEGLALGATISLLNENGAADIVSEPSLLCLNNKESSIYVGETRSIKTGTTTTDGGNINDTYKREDIGLTLKVKPRISNGNKVLLDISTKLEDVAQTTTNDQPNTSKKDLVTTAIVHNGESVILGGYIRDKFENKVVSVPLLGDIPILGNMFKDTSKINDKINLVIIITPYIVPKSKDLTYVREQLAQLSLLEEKYTKDALLRLEKEKVRQKQNDKKRQEEFQEVLKQQKETTSNEDRHEDIIKKTFGL